MGPGRTHGRGTPGAGLLAEFVNPGGRSYEVTGTRPDQSRYGWDLVTLLRKGPGWNLDGASESAPDIDLDCHQLSERTYEDQDRPADTSESAWFPETERPITSVGVPSDPRSAAGSQRTLRKAIHRNASGRLCSIAGSPRPCPI
jgi:uncharacterized protein RhaS with RHS repeats